MTLLKVISGAISNIKNYQNDLRPTLLDLNELSAILERFKRADSNPERELSVEELFELGSFVLIQCRINRINFYQPLSILKPLIDSISTDNLAFIDFLYCSKNLIFDFFSVFSKLNPKIKTALPKILNELLYYECCSFKEGLLNLILDNIGKDNACDGLETVLNYRCKFRKAFLQEIIIAILESRCPNRYAYTLLDFAEKKIELTPSRLQTLKNQEHCIEQILAVVVMLKANNNHIDQILLHPNLPVLNKTLHLICNLNFYSDLWNHGNHSLRLSNETLLRFLSVESIDIWWNAIILLRKHQLLTGNAIDELLNHPTRVSELSRMSHLDGEKELIEKFLYAGNDLGDEKHFSSSPIPFE